MLSSCVGIAFIWTKGGRCGLAHCLLPKSPSSNGLIGARYVSQAVPSLLLLMGIKELDHPNGQVILAGGAKHRQLTLRKNRHRRSSTSTGRYPVSCDR